MEKILNRKVRILLLCLVGMLMAVKGVAQAIIVKGSVKDKTGEAIIGANVLVKGTTNGTITDFNGNFALDAKKGDILVISYIGFRNQELPAASDMKITLVEDAEIYNPQIQISAESETKRSIFREKDKTKRSKKESAQHSKSRNKSFVMTSVSAL